MEDVSARSWSPRCSSTRWKGPALTTTTYVDSGGVSGKVQVRTPSAGSPTASGRMFDNTVHASGERTVKRWGALRSGWSKQAHNRRASSHSREVQT